MWLSSGNISMPNCHLSNQVENKTEKFLIDKTKGRTIKEHKFHLSKYKINLTNDIQNLPVMYWIPIIHKNPYNFRFIIASTVFSI